MNNKSTIILLLTLLMLIEGIANAQKYVDLGLPSGTLWADRNVGASSSEDYGDYFSWGETTTKSDYSWSTYKYYNNGGDEKLTKYCSESACGNNGYTDTLTTLERSDDAAIANWGSDWRTPTPQQFQELKDYCTWTWATRNGKNGYEVKGKNGNSIFLPAAGYRDGTSLYRVGSCGSYWSSALVADSPDNGCSLNFHSGRVNPDRWSCRWYGFSVRPVRCRN